MAFNTKNMKNFIILYKPNSLDERVELDIVKSNTNKNAMFKWLEDNRNTSRHFVGYNNQPITEEDAELYTKDYEKFRSKNYKESRFFGYN